MTKPVERVIAALEERGLHPRENEDGYKASCPSHDDHDPSLSVSEGDDGKALVCCHAGCTIEEVVDALGLSVADLMADNGDPATRLKPKPHWLFIPAPNSAPPPEPHSTLGKMTSRWAYLDAEGLLIGYVCRWDTPDEKGDKEIRPLTFGRMSDEAPGIERWEWRSWPVPAPLYGLNALEENSTAVVLVAEGEKTADAASELFPDLLAVTSPGGSNRAHNADWSPLKGRRVVVWPDQDGAGRKYGAEVARLALKAGAESVAAVDVPQDWPEGWDLADDPPEGVTVPNLLTMIEGAASFVETTTPTGANQNPIAPLRDLPDDADVDDIAEALRLVAVALRGTDQLTRAVAREKAVEMVGARLVKAPAALVDAALAVGAPVVEEDAATLVLADPELWPHPVDGAGLLDEIVSVLRRFLVLPEGCAETVALWVVHSHSINAADISPILAITSPEKRCGKTLLLDILGGFVPRPLSTANITAAALFRTVEKFCPTLLVDEADTFMGSKDDLRGVLNSGHRRSSAVVIRTVGDDHEPAIFSTWSPKVLAMIGNPPPTIEDRSIVIRMRRRAAGETIERWRADRQRELKPLCQRAARWAVDHIGELRDSDPEIAESLHDRAADNWRPLLAIADAVGGDWPVVARKVAVTIGNAEVWAESPGVLLLSDLRDLFRRKGTDRLTSKEIVDSLQMMEDRPWPEYGRNNKPITTRQLAALLRPFEIIPLTIRTETTRAKGYMREAFADAWGRYAESETDVHTTITGIIDPCHRDSSTEESSFGESSSVTSDKLARIQSPGKPNNEQHGHAVTDRERRAEVEGEYGEDEEPEVRDNAMLF